MYVHVVLGIRLYGINCVTFVRRLLVGFLSAGSVGVLEVMFFGLLIGLVG